MTNKHPLRLNVGFLIHQSVGYQRVFPLAFENIRLGEDLLLDQLSGQAEITRTPQGLLVEVKLHGECQSECVRCLSESLLQLETEFVELFAFEARKTKDAEFILPEDGIIDLEPLAREALLVEVPINPLCKPDCNGLCPVCGNNLNEENCRHDQESIDPRLETLKNLTRDSGAS